MRKNDLVRLGWKIYFWIIASMYMLVFGNALGSTASDVYDYINVPISLIGIIGLYGYAHQTAIAKPDLWKVSIFLVIVWDILQGVVELRKSGSENTIFAFMLSLGFLIPQYIALYFYGYRSTQQWEYKRFILSRSKKFVLLPLIFAFAFFLSHEFGPVPSSKSILRSTPYKHLSENDAKNVIIQKGFFEFKYNISGSGFTNNFEIQGDGEVVIDHASGLMWQQSGSGFMIYEEARAYINQLNKDRFAGYRDWRLPTLEEIMSLMERENKSGLWIDPVFDTKQQYIWTSDKENLFSPRVWIVDFLYGYCNLDRVDKRSIESRNNVRAVRTLKKAEYSATKDVYHDPTISYYTRSIEMNPRDFEAYINRGNAYAATGSYDQAISDYTKALVINPNLAEPYLNLGTIYGKLGRYDLAFTNLNKCIAINPSDGMAYVNRGNTYFSLGRYNLALVDYNKAIEINPTIKDAYFNRAKTYKKLGKVDLELDDYTKVIEINPDDAEAFVSRGITYGDLSKLNLAIADFTKAISINPDLADAYLFRGLIYAKLSMHELAVQDCEKFIQLAQSNPKLRSEIPEIQNLIRKLEKQ